MLLRRICKLVRESKDFNDAIFLKLVEECCDACVVCMKYKRPLLGPVVGFPLSNEFNEAVCMD